MSEQTLIPKLTDGQRSVVFAEASTGILLTPEGDRHLGQAKCYRVFNWEEEAIVFARAYVEPFRFRRSNHFLSVNLTGLNAGDEFEFVMPECYANTV